jgi:hypothetical protein
MNALVGKYFIGVYDGCTRSGIVEAAIDATNYLVRFDGLISFPGDPPLVLALVPVGDMISCGCEEAPPPWCFFDNEKQRARYDEWVKEPPKDQATPRVVPLKPSVN